MTSPLSPAADPPVDPDPVEHAAPTTVELDLDLRDPTRPRARCRLSLVARGEGNILLACSDRMGDVRWSVSSGTPAPVACSGRADGAQCWVVRAPAAGPIELVARYELTPTHPSDGDWQGALISSEREVRISAYSRHCPLVPLVDREAAPTRWTLRVETPPDWSLLSSATEVAGDGAARVFRTRAFAPPALVGGPLRSIESTSAPRVSVLHRDLAPATTERLAGHVDGAATWYATLLGSEVPPTIGLYCGEADYHWSAPGLVVLGRLPGSDPVRLLAHETAHFWMGGRLSFLGRHARALTEGLAEYLAWRYVEHERDGTAALQCAARTAHDLHDALMAAGSEGSFRLSDDTWSYGVAPLTLRAMAESVGRPVFDRALRAVVRNHDRGFCSWEDLERSIAAAGGRRGDRPAVPWSPFDELVDLSLGEVHLSGEAVVVEVRASRVDRAGRRRPFEGRIELAVRWDGAAVTTDVEVGGGVGRARIPGAREPLRVELDPRFLLPARRVPPTLVTDGGSSRRPAPPPTLRCAPSKFDDEDGTEQIDVRFDEPMDGRKGFRGSQLARLRSDGCPTPDLVSSDWIDVRTLRTRFRRPHADRPVWLPFDGRRLRSLAGIRLQPTDVEVPPPTVGDR